MFESLYEWFVVLLVLIIFGYGSYVKKSLDRFGVGVAVAVGAVTYYLGGIELFSVMVVFFLAAEFCTRYARKVTGEGIETRTTGNILGNSGAALIALVFASPLAFFGAIATALADTLSSEIGMLSEKRPRLITSLAKVERGADGGVTLLGFGAAILGAGVVAMMCFFLTGWNPVVLVVITAAGFAGGAIDSLLGALFEREGKLNNTEVNFLASASGAAIAYALGTLLI